MRDDFSPVNQKRKAEMNVIEALAAAATERSAKEGTAEVQEFDQPNGGQGENDASRLDPIPDISQSSSKDKDDPTDDTGDSEDDNSDEFQPESYWTCDGTCEGTFAVFEGLNMCRFCLDSIFCDDCLKILRNEGFPFRVCHPKHEFMKVPKFDQTVPAGSVMVGEKTVSIEEWISKLKQDWGF